VSLRSCALLLLAVWSLPASALLLRGDRDDAEYIELATRYPATVLFADDGGEGVLIAPRWVLTAAHRAHPVKTPRKVHKVVIGGKDYEVEKVFAHPDATGGGASDIALVLLKDAVKDVEPNRLYRRDDELGKAVAIVGYGNHGKIGDKPRTLEKDRRLRAAINTVDRVWPASFGLKLKHLDEASDLQGAIVAAESGGPAFIEGPEGIQVAGIAQFIDDVNNQGDWQLYLRVSAFVPWIEAQMMQVAKDEAEALLGSK
jgi:hypothetical protein